MIYVWRCKNCKNEQAVERPVSDFDKEPEEPCCSNPRRVRVIRKTYFVLKGKGWYAKGGY